MMKYYLMTSVLPFLFFMLWYFLTPKKRKDKRKSKTRISTDGITDPKETTANLVNDISKARPLYEKLMVSIHPDQFTGENKIKAQEIAARLTPAKLDFDSLCLIEKEIADFKKNLY